MLIYNKLRMACGIEIDENFIVTGGLDESAQDGALNTVAKYSQMGLVEFLPTLNERRAGHACASFLNDKRQTVCALCIVTVSKLKH